MPLLSFLRFYTLSIFDGSLVVVDQHRRDGMGFSCDLGVANDVFIPLVLQGARADEKAFVDFSPRKVELSSE